MRLAELKTVTTSGGTQVEVLTQAEYDALSSVNPEILYIIKG